MLRLQAAREDRDRVVVAADAVLRDLVVRARAAGMPMQDIHKATGLSQTTIRNYVRREHGTLIRPPIQPPDEVEPSRRSPRAATTERNR